MSNTLHSRILSRSAAIGILAIGTLALASCGDDNDSSTTTPDPAVVASGQWARTSPAMASAGAVYVTLTSNAYDKLVAAKVDASVTGTVELHETVMAEDETEMTGMGSDTTEMGGGEMSMRPVEFIELPAGVAVSLEPGGYHIMLLDLVAPLELGSTIQVTLVFEVAGEMTIDVPVLDEAP